MSGGHITWRNTAELADLLAAERDALDAQITALRSPPDESTYEGIVIAVICEYLITGSPDAVAHWATSKGWRLRNPNPNGKKDTLQFSPALVRGLIATPPPEAPPIVVELCRRVFAVQSKPMPWKDQAESTHGLENYRGRTRT